MNIYEVLRKPIITEKSTRLSESNKYAFEVDSKASKSQVKMAIEKVFNVGVVDVNVITVPGEVKRTGKRETKRSAWKKAIITIKKGDKIQFFEGV